MVGVSHQTTLSGCLSVGESPGGIAAMMSKSAALLARVSVGGAAGRRRVTLAVIDRGARNVRGGAHGKGISTSTARAFGRGS